MSERLTTSEVIRNRLENGKDDGNKLALWLIGDAMGSGYMLGMALALGRHHITPVFDTIYGVSAGAVAGAYLLARQPEATRIFYEDINNKNFINKRRYPMVNLDYLEYVMTEKRPLLWERVAKSKIEFNVCVTELSESGVSTVTFNRFEDRDQLITPIIDSCRMPFGTGGPRKAEDGVFYTDGVVSTGGFDYQQVMADGCTHVLVLQPHPNGYGEQRMPINYAERFASTMLFREYPMLAQAVIQITKKYVVALRDIKRAERIPQYYPIGIEGIRVHSSYPVTDILETDAQTLWENINIGYKAGTARIRSWEA